MYTIAILIYFGDRYLSLTREWLAQEFKVSTDILPTDQRNISRKSKESSPSWLTSIAVIITIQPRMNFRIPAYIVGSIPTVTNTPGMVPIAGPSPSFPGSIPGAEHTPQTDHPPSSQKPDVTQIEDSVRDGGASDRTVSGDELSIGNGSDGSDWSSD